MKNTKKIFALLLILTISILALSSCMPTGAGGTGGTSGAGTTGTETPTWLAAVTTILPFALLIVVFYFFMLRPQKKQQKEAQNMRDSVGRGDTVCTTGGIVGVVITVKDDMVLIESSGDKTKIQVQKWAIHTILEKAE
ncbi:MAG: preprotein translocase subunit YajC [Clostridia bacterium]